MRGALKLALIGGGLVAALAAPRAAGGQDHDPMSSPPPGLAADGVFVGGSLGLSFGDVDYVEIAPLIGTWLGPQVTVGGSLIFRYRNDGRYAEDLSTTDYGASAFAEYYVFNPVYLHVEVEYLSYEHGTFDFSTERDGFTSVFVGGGASTAMSGRSSLYVQVLYNLSYVDDEPSPYSSPWVTRFGVAVGF
ncbi:MAG TPA: hypothetical protein PKJ99_04795 [Thermoanaerobaculales bacterium]|nr:hypothetical protein [Thermoanaerobaculales bacterium]HPA81510.1 hypothetical protein [Thermoanaerobaculales bacterium]HQL30264.1 hypothetical protein [Thermoanaerobaculales bacterium]HQN97087.1 hypothetical protein [Thermoanaerobaculales bacterium]HQP42458.1 hypothetical protein [Thermoanaerobaculales bacterium]